MKYKIHSFRNAELIFKNDERYKKSFSSLLEILDQLSDDDIINKFNSIDRHSMKSFSEPINKLLDERLKKEGWKNQTPIFNDSEFRENSKNNKHPWTIDFANDEISMEVAFNHGGVVAWNLVKLVLAGELNHVKKGINTSAGIIICATDNFKKKWWV